MSRRFLLLLYGVFWMMSTWASSYQLTSPDGNYRFIFTQQEHRLWYSVSYKGQPVILRSEMGLDIDNRLFESALGIPHDSCTFWGENLVLRGIDREAEDTVWQPVYGEESELRDHYNQLTLHFGKGNGGGSVEAGSYDKRKFYLFDIKVRAYDEGVAFCYGFPEQSNGLFLNITGERTQFSFPSGTTAFYEEWAQGPYSRIPLGQWPEGKESERPLTLLLPGGLHVALLEARMVNYARGKFRRVGENTLQVSLYGGVEVMSPFSTPWRVIMAGEKAVDLVNHKQLVLNLNDPSEIAETSWILPGKAYRCGSLDWKSILKGIRFAEQQKMQYIELDAGWYGPEQFVVSSALKVGPNRDFTIPEVCDSARKHGLGVFLYVNQRALYHQLDSILPLYHQWGVAGIKFGFVQVGNQMWTTWLHDAVRKCAKYHLLVDIHDEYRPTGFSRTYPNLLTQEGVMGNEMMPDATHDVTLPFTRYLCGPADYTLCYYSDRIKNTRGHQLAMAAVYYSPLQFLHWYGKPEVYDGGRELKFWQDIPTVFEESRALDGEVGEYIIQARRSGTTWFVGAMTNTEARDVIIFTSEFLRKGRQYRVELYQDDPSLNTRSKVASSVMKIKGGQVLKLHLQPSGGAALEFHEE